MNNNFALFLRISSNIKEFKAPLFRSIFIGLKINISFLNLSLDIAILFFDSGKFSSIEYSDKVFITES